MSTPDYYAKTLALTEAEKASGQVKLDPYRVAHVYPKLKENPEFFQAFKKLACAGERGAKSVHLDVEEAIGALKRWQELNPRKEDLEPVYTSLGPDDTLLETDQFRMKGDNVWLNPNHATIGLNDKIRTDKHWDLYEYRRRIA